MIIETTLDLDEIELGLYDDDEIDQYVAFLTDGKCECAEDLARHMVQTSLEASGVNPCQVSIDDVIRMVSTVTAALRIKLDADLCDWSKAH